MLCPIDSTELRMTERQGVEIDYCPKCRCVWLDRGELDKILERSATEAPRRQHDDDDDDWDDPGIRGGLGSSAEDDDERPRGPSESGRPRKKRKSFLSDLFDFE